MKMFLNGELGIVTQYVFENGWTINVTRNALDQCEVTILPVFLVEMFSERLPFPAKLRKEYDRADMIKRGDYFPDFKGTDDELLDVIVSVASRPTEPAMDATRRTILHAAKKGKVQ